MGNLYKKQEYLIISFSPVYLSSISLNIHKMLSVLLLSTRYLHNADTCKASNIKMKRRVNLSTSYQIYCFTCK